MLNLYAVTVWHSNTPRNVETIEVRTYSAKRAEHLASESFPGCRALAKPVGELTEASTPPYSRWPERAH